MIKPEERTVRIGELLIRAGFCTRGDLDEALEIAKDSGQLVGRVLTMSGFVKDDQLNAALRAQERLRAGGINIDEAVQALRIADRNGAPFDYVLDQVKHQEHHNLTA